MISEVLIKYCKQNASTLLEAMRTIAWREHGLSPRELLLFYSMARVCKAECLIESGTGLGSTTELLAKLFGEAIVHTIEPSPQSPDKTKGDMVELLDINKQSIPSCGIYSYEDFVQYAQKNSLGLNFHTGHPTDQISELLERNQKAPTIVLVHQPRGLSALKLVENVLQKDHVCFAAIHIDPSDHSMLSACRQSLLCPLISSDVSELSSPSLEEKTQGSALAFCMRENWAAKLGLRARVPQVQAQAPLDAPSASSEPREHQLKPIPIRPLGPKPDQTRQDNVSSNPKPKHLDDESLFQRLVSKPAEAKLEIAGLWVGDTQSLKSWANYFPRSRIAGFDSLKEHHELCKNVPNIRIEPIDPRRYHVTPNYFDMIIDHAPDSVLDKATKFYHCIEWLKPGGIYLIQDLHGVHSGDPHRLLKKPERLHVRLPSLDFFDRLMRSCEGTGTLQSVQMLPGWLMMVKGSS